MRRALLVCFLSPFVACGGSTLTIDDDAGNPGASDAAVDGTVAQDGGGGDGAAQDGARSDGSARRDAGDYACTGMISRVDPAYATCASASDCVIVLGSCYCGNAPAFGVASRYQTAAEACETQRGNNCGLGCVSGTDIVAQDGKTASNRSVVSVRCVAPPDGGAKICLTYVP